MVLAIPLHRFLDVDPALLAGKVVVDAMNYWPASDGVLTAFEDGVSSGTGSSEIVAGRRARPWSRRSTTSATTSSRTEPGRRAPDRRASGVAGDDPAAVATVAG